jgi:hypothetical protein
MGTGNFFFKGGSLILQYFLKRCVDIDLRYVDGEFGPGDPQVVVITFVAGGTVGFVKSWLTTGAVFAAPALLTTGFVLRSLAQQFIHKQMYEQFKLLMNEYLKEFGISNRLKFIFAYPPVGQTSPSLMMEEISNNPALQSPIHNFVSDSEFKQRIANILENEFGLIKNPTVDEIRQIIGRKQKFLK